MRRAGLDYHDLSNVTRHPDYFTFVERVAPNKVYAITTKGNTRYTDVAFKPGDALLFGSETDGLPSEVMNSVVDSDRVLIPMRPNNRSLNLSNSVSILAYEAWRQMGFDGAV